MEKVYWLSRKRASLKMRKGGWLPVPIDPHDLAGRYALKAGSAKAQTVDLADSIPPAICAGSPSFDDADDA